MDVIAQYVAEAMRLFVKVSVGGFAWLFICIVVIMVLAAFQGNKKGAPPQ